MLDPLFYASRPWYGAFLAQRSLRVVTQPTGEQITLDQARTHLRLDTYGSPLAHPDDDIIETVYIPAAREMCEMLSGRAMAPTVYELGLGAFPAGCARYPFGGIDLRIGPVSAITAVEYTDAAGATVALVEGTDYQTDRWTEPGYVYPEYNTSWPTARAASNAVRVRFMSGYELPAASPQDVPLPNMYRMAMLLLLGHFYENREETSAVVLSTIPMGVRALLDPDSLRIGFA